MKAYSINNKNKLFFILGRNPELSRAEIFEFLKTRNKPYKEILFENNLLIIETRCAPTINIQEFGGVMWLGQITFEGNSQEFEKQIIQTEIVPADKFSYAIFGNQDTQILKNEFKKQKKKAIMKHGRNQIQFQDGDKQEFPKADFYIFYHKHNNIIYFGIATQNYDNAKVKNRDINKPVRREFLAISPRLSKILINLSGAKPHDLLLDPFCGVGGILQEAILKQINVYGIDKDKQATDDAKVNLKWLTSQRRAPTNNKNKSTSVHNINTTYKIEKNDSRQAPDLQFSAIATETPLGKILRKKPSNEQAKQIILNFESYIIPILRRLKSVKKPSAKIAITFPTIRTFHVNIKKITKKTGLKIYLNPILESRPDQFISRDILVFH